MDVVCGLDVGRDKVAATVLGDGFKESGTFGVGIEELLRLKDWLRSRGCLRVVMESTGVYWVPIYASLEEGGFEVSLANSHQVRLYLALTAIAMVDIWEWTPFMIWVLLAGLQSLPPEPFEAASIDGASSWQTFRHITLPLMRRPIAVALLIRSMDAFRCVDIIYMMTKGGPGKASETLSILSWRTGFMYFNMGEATALALIMLFIIEAFCWLYIKFAFKSVSK